MPFLGALWTLPSGGCEFEVGLGLSDQSQGFWLCRAQKKNCNRWCYPHNRRKLATTTAASRRCRAILRPRRPRDTKLFWYGSETLRWSFLLDTAAKLFISCDTFGATLWQNSFALVVLGYHTSIAQHVAELGVAMLCLGVVLTHLPCEISEANLRQFQWVFPWILVDVQSISMNLQSISISFSRFQSI